MALKVCNACSARFYDGEECPECKQSGRGEIRDYHWLHDEDATAGVDGEDVDLDHDGIPDDDEDVAGQREALDTAVQVESLDGHSRNRLSALARERGLDPSGTKAELLARLQETAQG